VIAFVALAQTSVICNGPPTLSAAMDNNTGIAMSAVSMYRLVCRVVRQLKKKLFFLHYRLSAPARYVESD